MQSVNWIVIHIAHTQQEAERLQDKLSAEGFFIRVQQRAQLGIWELRATESESVPAREFIMEHLHEQE